MAGTIVVDRIESDGSYASTINVASKVNFTGGMQIGGQDTTFAGIRNKVINGHFIINQRNGTNAVTTSSDTIYVTDRWRTSVVANAATITYQHTSDAPTGFSSSLSMTVATPTSNVATMGQSIVQPIEGFNTVDFGQGVAGANPITMSFWVKSSVTGTYTVFLRNSGGIKSCVRAYTINQANTWEYKTVTFTGETSGTWNKDETSGCFVNFTLGSGSNSFVSQDGVWQTGQLMGVAGMTQFNTVSNAVMKITGVQLEKGSVATPFENRFYTTELQFCQRYYYRHKQSNPNNITFGVGVVSGTMYANRCYHAFPVAMRAAPTASFGCLAGGSNPRIYDGSAAPTVTAVQTNTSSVNGSALELQASGGGLTSGRCAVVIDGSDAYFDFSAEL